MKNIPKILREKGTVWEWLWHIVLEWNWDYVWKIPKNNNLRYQDAEHSLDYFRRNLWAFFPPTKLLENESNYIVVQKRINGVRLCDIPSDQITPKILSQLLTIIQLFEKTLQKDFYHLDIMWPVWKDVSSTEKDTHPIPNIIKRKIHVLIHLRDIFKSENIMVDQDWNLFLIDNVLELVEKKMSLRLQHRALYAWYKNKVQSALDSHEPWL